MGFRWRDKDLREVKRRGRAVREQASAKPLIVPRPVGRIVALGQPPVERMNATEAAYDAYLRQQQYAGLILWHRFEAIKLRLADGSYFTPDFCVVTAEREFQCHETKGFWREAARVRIKVAAGLFPFKFIAIKRIKGQWVREEF
jgi:hypothetical protein